MFFVFFFFFFNDTATTEIYTLSLHDALPILRCREGSAGGGGRSRRRSLSGSRRGRPHPRERFGEEDVLLRRADSHPNRLGSAKARKRANDHTFAEQRLERGLRVFAEVDEHEVRNGRADQLVAGFRQDSLELHTAF